MVIDFKYPLLSWWGYELDNPVPIFPLMSKGYNTNFYYYKEDIHPENWGPMVLPDQERVLCGDGDEDNCYNWYYLARYDQYVLIIWFWRGASAASFHEVVQSVTQEFEAALAE
jgi:hypothetical protein